MSDSRGSTQSDLWGTSAALFVSLLVFWFVLSSQYNALFITMGVVSAALVTAVTAPLITAILEPRRHPLGKIPLRLWYLLVYLAWLAWSVMVSSLQVAWIVINPRVPPEPMMLRFRTRLPSRLARVMLANTISLVPGTMTVRLEGDEYLVHALVPSAAGDLLDGSMQSMIARVFLDEPEQPIDPRWETPPEVFT
jgi:multicomponent Na+:H+ antiporter subunit E